VSRQLLIAVAHVPRIVVGGLALLIGHERVLPTDEQPAVVRIQAARPFGQQRAVAGRVDMRVDFVRVIGAVGVERRDHTPQYGLAINRSIDVFVLRDGRRAQSYHQDR